MNTKAVSIRVSTVGGKAVVQEFQQIGSAGSKALDSIEKGSKSSGLAVQNASYQVGDFFVQIAGGQDPLRALGQQLPQLLGGMGLIGALAGTAVAGLSVLWTVFGEGGEASETLEEEIKGVREALTAYSAASDAALEPMDRLIEKYGSLAESVREARLQQAEMARGEAIRAVNGLLGNAEVQGGADAFSADQIAGQIAEREQALERLKAAEVEFREAVAAGDQERMQQLAAEELQLKAKLATLADIREAVSDTAAEYAITTEQAQAMAVAVQRVRDAAGGSAQEQIDAASTLSDLLFETYGSIDAANEATDGLVTRLSEAVLAAADVAATDMASGIGDAADEADRLAANLSRAARNNYQRLVEGGGLDAIARAGNDQLAYDSDGELSDGAGGVRSPSRTSRGGRRGGGGRNAARTAEMREAERLFEATRTEAEQYAAAVADIDALLGKGLITQDTYNRALDQAGEKYLELGDSAKFWEDINQSLKDSIIDLGVDGAASFDDIGRSIKRAAFEALLFKTGPLAGIFGGGGAGGGGFGGFLSGLLSFEGGGYTGDGPRSGGLDGRGGFLAINHPRETITDHLAAGSGGVVGGGATVRVEAVPNPYFDLRVAQISSAGDQRAAQMQRRAMPRVLRDTQARGL